MNSPEQVPPKKAAIEFKAKLPEDEYMAALLLAESRNESFSYTLRRALVSELMIQKLLVDGTLYFQPHDSEEFQELVFPDKYTSIPDREIDISELLPPAEGEK